MEIQEVVEVVAERELIHLDNTSSRTVITGDVIASQPVDDIARTVGLTAGFVEGSFRGGRIDNGEVKYFIDDVDVSNPIAEHDIGAPAGQGNADMATDIPEAAVQEVQVITGGMSAQYGAKSAVVNIITKSGGSNFSGYMRTKMTPSEYGDGNIIDYSFGQPTGYISHEKMTEQRKHVGTGSADVNDDYYAPPSKQFLNPRFRRYEIGFGGPIPLTGLGVGGSMSFNINGDFIDRGGFFVGQSGQQETWNLKLVYNTASNSTFTFTFLTSHGELTYNVHYYRSIVTTGDTLYGYNKGSEKPYKVLVGSIVHPDGTLEAVKNYDMTNNIPRSEYGSNLFALSYKNTVSSKTFYKLDINYFMTEGKSRTYDPATGKPLGLDDFRTLRFANPAHSDFFPPGAPTALTLESEWFIQPMFVLRDRQDDCQTVWTFAGDLVSQLNEYNELRIGAEFKLYDLYMWYEGLASGGNEYTNFFEDIRPKKISAYIEDKIETNGMIVNAGLRFVFFDPDAIVPENFTDPLVADAKDPNSELYQNPLSPAEDRIKNPTQARSRSILMPRLGIAFPISAHDVFHINYGHYYGMPNMGTLYENYSWAMLGAYKYMGNPNMDWEKIISYEAGVEHGFSDDVKLVITGFYKDIADLVNKQKFRDDETGTPYWVNINADYAEVKGFEVALKTRRWYNTILNIAYTYSRAKGKNSNNRQAF